MKKHAFKANHPNLVVDENLFVPRRARIIEIKEMSPIENYYKLELVDGSTIGGSGEFIAIALPNIGEAPISLCSPSVESNQFEILVRRITRPGQNVTNGPLLNTVTMALHKMKVGDIIGVRGAFGTVFPLEDYISKDVLIIPGGLGIAPARRPILDIVNNRQDYGKVRVLYGARAPDMFLFDDEFQKWNDAAIEIYRSVNEKAEQEWNETVGFGTELYKAIESDIDSRNTVAYIVGPEPMFIPNILELLRLGLNPKNIYCSLENNMKCCVGKCGHCRVNDILLCVKGPVLSLAFIWKNKMWEALGKDSFKNLKKAMKQKNWETI